MEKLTKEQQIENLENLKREFDGLFEKYNVKNPQIDDVKARISVLVAELKAVHHCAACNKDITDKHKYVLPLFVHITNPQKFGGHCEIVDGEIEHTSGRTESLKFCISCYNKVASAAKDKLDQIRKDKESK